MDELRSVEGIEVQIVTVIRMDDLRGIANEGTLNYVLLEEGDFLVCEQRQFGRHIHHSILASGKYVRAAGELEIALLDGEAIVMSLSNNSGHYRPRPECLDFIAEMLERLGFEVPTDSIKQSN